MGRDHKDHQVGGFEGLLHGASRRDAGGKLDSGEIKGILSLIQDFLNQVFFINP
jgi:hypothetical protein